MDVESGDVGAKVFEGACFPDEPKRGRRLRGEAIYIVKIGKGHRQVTVLRSEQFVPRGKLCETEREEIIRNHNNGPAWFGDEVIILEGSQLATRWCSGLVSDLRSDTHTGWAAPQDITAAFWLEANGLWFRSYHKARVHVVCTLRLTTRSNPLKIMILSLPQNDSRFSCLSSVVITNTQAKSVCKLALRRFSLLNGVESIRTKQNTSSGTTLGSFFQRGQYIDNNELPLEVTIVPQGLAQNRVPVSRSRGNVSSCCRCSIVAQNGLRLFRFSVNLLNPPCSPHLLTRCLAPQRTHRFIS